MIEKTSRDGWILSDQIKKVFAEADIGMFKHFAVRLGIDTNKSNEQIKLEVIYHFENSYWWSVYQNAIWVYLRPLPSKYATKLSQTFK